ncbi:hypothetical protein Sjap_007471 [Stephania japonica]|uniref:Phytochrome A-associated F-box protein n=1 Tax=Stephania japonica TaxID=461633 RepID=A0AAP0JQ25_9MAGN
MSTTTISYLTDDVILIIFNKLEADPRNWARLACVCTKFNALISNTCYRNKCSNSIPSIVSELLSISPNQSHPPGGWPALHKLSICCPGLLRAGVLLENSDFGLHRELGPDHNYRPERAEINPTHFERGEITPAHFERGEITPTHFERGEISPTHLPNLPNCPNLASSSCETPNLSWSLFDDLYFDTLYDVSETAQSAVVAVGGREREGEGEGEGEGVEAGGESGVLGKRRKKCRSLEAHLASGVWNLSREQGKKLLASRFRGDCLYISDWPGCVHTEEKRKYMLFRGVFKNFKRSQVWRTINDGNRSKIGLDCAFCCCKETWDLHSAFCLRRVFGYHDDGEPVVRAYVCENGHVSGAWTDRPMFT